MTSAIQSLRILCKYWKLTAIAILSLSIAMALSALSLSVLNTFLLLPPAAAEPNRLVMLYSHSSNTPIEQISYPDYKYIRENNHVFTDVAAAPNSMSFQQDTSGGQNVKLLSRPVTDNYLAVLGIRPYLGRLFAPGDDESKMPIAVMTYNCWKRLGSDPRIVGKVVAGNTIVGVTPKEFTGSLFGLNGDLLVPLFAGENNPVWRTQRNARRLFLVARLKPGVSRREAQTELESMSGQLSLNYPQDEKGHTAILTRATLLPPDAIPTAELVTGLLMALVLLVLLIACANVANLLLAVATGRRQEAAIKLALGISRGRLMREFLKESAIICIASSALGYSIAAFVITRFSNINVSIPLFGTVPLGFNFHLDTMVFICGGVLMLLAVFATGLAPALYASSPDLSQMLSGEIVIGGRKKRAWRSALVIVQVAVCTLVLVGMGLCQRSLYNLRHVDPGFSARNLITASVYPATESHSHAQGKAIHEKLRRSVLGLAGVESVSLASTAPLLGQTPATLQTPDTGKKVSIGSSVVDENYFSTLGIPIVSGRGFNSGDREGGVDAIIINQKMAESFWPGKDPVGKTVLTGDPTTKAIVIGVARDGKYLDLDEPARPFLYYALSQHFQEPIDIIARTNGDPRLWLQPLAQIVHSAGESVLQPVTYANWINMTLLTERIAAGCVAVLSALGLSLAIVGLFGAISYSVSERKKELGIRVALGARPWQLLRMVLRQTIAIAGAGVAIGILLGIATTILLRSQFYQVSAFEWTVLLPVTMAMVAVSLLVAYLSARTWIQIDPMEAVRHA